MASGADFGKTASTYGQYRPPFPETFFERLSAFRNRLGGPAGPRPGYRYRLSFVWFEVYYIVTERGIGNVILREPATREEVEEQMGLRWMIELFTRLPGMVILGSLDAGCCIAEVHKPHTTEDLGLSCACTRRPCSPRVEPGFDLRTW